MSMLGKRHVVPLLVLSVVVTACGKKGPPRPPVKVRPQAISDLSVRQEGRTVVVTFSLPTTATTGVELRDLREVEVLRLAKEEPQVAEPEPAEEEGDLLGAMAPRGRFIPAQEFEKQAEILRVLGRADLPGALEGTKLRVVDDLATEPIGGVAPNRFYYGVVVRDGEGRESDVSNIESILPMEAPPAPSSLQARVGKLGVDLSWSPPSAPVAPAGYNVYRLDEGGALKRLNTLPVKETSFTDPRPPEGVGEASYLVRSSATSTEPFVESADAARASVSLADATPPLPPSGVRVAAGPSRLEVFWERSRSSDAVGYRIYRRSQGGEWLEVTDAPVPETVYMDVGTAAGVTYGYAVTAVDAAGNESERSEAADGRR